jgi:hypothetical protein
MLVAAVTATMLLLLVLAASANAASPDAMAATLGSVGGSPASSEPAAAAPAVGAEPADAPESVEATRVESVGDTASRTAESGLAAVSSPAPPTPPSTRAPSEAGAGDNLTAQVRELGAGTTSTDRVSELTGRIRQGTAETTAPIAHTVNTAAQVVDLTAPVGHVHALTHDPLQVASGALQKGSPVPIAPDSVENLRPPVEAPSRIDAGAFSHHTASRLPSALPTGGHPRYRATIVDSLMQHFAEFGGVKPLQLGVARVAGDPSQAPAPVGADAPANAGGRSVNLAPRDGNGPPPSSDSPQAAASGLGGSSFVPIVALLALLASAAPAILRRLGEGPEFRAPAPFVCALERPG